MKPAICTSVAGISLLLSACVVSPTTASGTRIDEVPMYGGIDREKYPTLKEGDQTFIERVTEHFGSREKAADVWINSGFRYYNNNQLDLAMRRFNQAWLLNPKNSEVFMGFSAVLHDQKKYCQAMDMAEHALTLKPPSYQGIFPDAGLIIVLCVVNQQNETITPEKKAQLLERSESLFQKAEEVELNKAYVFNNWAKAYYLRADYPKAWEAVAKARKLGSKISEKFLADLRNKMPEPSSSE